MNIIYNFDADVTFAFAAEYNKGSSASSPVASASSPRDLPKPASDSVKPFEFSRPLDLTIRTDKPKYLHNEVVQVEIQSPMVPCDGNYLLLLHSFVLTSSYRTSLCDLQGCDAH